MFIFGYFKQTCLHPNATQLTTVLRVKFYSRDCCLFCASYNTETPHIHGLLRYQKETVVPLALSVFFYSACLTLCASSKTSSYIRFQLHAGMYTVHWVINILLSETKRNYMEEEENNS